MNDNFLRPTWGARLACLLYESLIVIAVTVVGVVFPYTFIGAAFGVTAGGRILLGHLFLALLLYFAWQWVRGGQTLAMKTWRIRLESADGGPVSPGVAILRYTLAWIGVMAAGVTFFWALFDREGRYLHDRLAGTRLVSVPRH